MNINCTVNTSGPIRRFRSSQRQKLTFQLLMGSIVLLGLFQNFDFFKLPVRKVNQDARASHARELLGHKYKGSYAQKAENMEDLHVSIYTNLYENFPLAFKDKATSVAQLIMEESEFYDLDPILVLAMIKTESKFDPLIRGSFGEIGLMQVKPDTAEWIAAKEGLKWKGPKTLEDPIANVKIGMAYLNYLRTTFSGSANKYISAYNMGAKNVRKLYAKDFKPKQYSVRVMKNYFDLYTQMVSETTTTKVANN